ncbi:MAG: dihydrofolate reductase family protein, partial [Actinomycetia bacterium]|nr:dihydrofolate reductase family protein [Actinomycetes bacterium]
VDDHRFSGAQSGPRPKAGSDSARPKAVPKVILESQVSVDGQMASADGSVDWMVWAWGNDWPWDEDLQRHHTDVMASAGCLLLSAEMAKEGFHEHWAEVASWTDNPQAEFAAEVVEKRKVIFSKSLPQSRWANSTIASGDLRAEIENLKQDADGDLVAFGGAKFASSLVAQDLVDEFHLLINPALVGSGRPIVSQLDQTLPLSLVTATPFTCGVVLMKYRRDR